MIRLPEMSGGINNTDAPHSIKDNQLQDESNMVFSGGAYKTRSGFLGTNTVIKNGKIAKHHFKDGFPKYDIVQSRNFDIKLNYLLSEEYKYANGSYTKQNARPMKISGLYVLQNDFRNLEGYVYGNLNTFLYTDEGAFIPVYMDDRREGKAPAVANPFDNGCTSVEAYTQNFITYSANPVLENGLGVFMYICGYWLGGEGYGFKLYEMKHLKDTEYANDANNFEDDGFHFAWVIVPEDKFYTPTVLVNGKGTSYSTLPADLSVSAPASNFESPNLLCKKVQGYFMTDGGFYTKEGAEIWLGSNTFVFPQIFSYTGDTVETRVLANDLIITYVDNRGEEQNITVSKGTWYTDGNLFISDFMGMGDVNYQVRVVVSWLDDRASTSVALKYNAGTVSEPNWQNLMLPRGVANNLKITGYTVDDGACEKFARFSNCTWFGGTAEGLSGGTRLFMWGSDLEPNKIIWSDVDNPLYFPKNNFAYVGEQNDPITVLAKQSNMLVIAKHFSLHYTTYVDNSSSYTAEEVISGNVNDVAAISAIFPLTQISGDIGCDLPRTMQLCANDLVWANSDGRVYTLKSASQYSECNVYELSYPVQNIICESIENDVLRERGGLQGFMGDYNAFNKTCFAMDYDGAYYLFLSHKIFVMQYSDTGFKYSYSYAEGNRVKSGISWDVIDIAPLTNDILSNYDYEWSHTIAKYSKSSRLIFGIVSTKGLFLMRDCMIWSQNNNTIPTRASQVILFGISEKDSNIYDISKAGTINEDKTYGIELSEITANSIYAEFTTKNYDIGQSFERKRIEHIYYSAKGTVGTQINVYAITDKGEEFIDRQIITTPNDEAERHIRHCLHGVKYLSLRVEIFGRAEIRGFAVKYKNLGGY